MINDKILAWLKTHPGSTSMMVAEGLHMEEKITAARMTDLHKQDKVTSQSIWISIRPGVQRAVHHYTAREVL